jgi:hypothetical protein
LISKDEEARAVAALYLGGDVGAITGAAASEKKDASSRSLPLSQSSSSSTSSFSSSASLLSSLPLVTAAAAAPASSPSLSFPYSATTAMHAMYEAVMRQQRTEEMKQIEKEHQDEVSEFRKEFGKKDKYVNAHASLLF